MAMQKAAFGTIMVIAFLGMFVTALGALTATQTLKNSATISATVGLGVYSNSACTEKLTSINWGTLTPGTSTAKTIYIKNEGTASIILSYVVGNWTPSAANVITVSCNFQSQTLSSGSITSATITITVPQNIQGVTSFSFDLAVKGTQQT
ncbi:MAG: hypothetical protein QW717_06305 [Candidatus Bathyarchaeia archaeon]